MKVSVFFDNYLPFHEQKDPGQIPLGLMENGLDAAVITVAKPELADYHPKFGFTQKSLDELYSDEFWTKDNSDVILAYPLRGTLYSPLLAKIKASGKKVLLKLDSDGKIAYPLQRDYFMVPLKERLSLRNIVGDVWWHVASESQKRNRHAAVALELIKRVELSDAVIIESPDAQSNLNYFLTAWGRSDLTKKTVFIPNPVRPEFTEAPLNKKEKTVVAFGRWDDYKQKNTAVMIQTIAAFLENRVDFKFIVFGGGIDILNAALADTPRSVKERMEILGFVEQPQIPQMLSKAKMLFVPSRWESFSIASGEALCMGSTLVGTPLESLRYLSLQGFSGTTASTFQKEALLAALIQDAFKWDINQYDQQKIAVFWRSKLNRKNVAGQIKNLILN